MPGITSFRRSILVGVLLFLGVSTFGDDVIRPCSRSLAIQLIAEETEEFENGTLRYDGQLYSRETYWRDNGSNHLFVCPCGFGVKCLRKCCRSNEVIRDSVCVATELRPPPLRLLSENLAPEFNNSNVIEDSFLIVQTNYCAYDYFSLAPEEASQDKFTLHTNGTLITPEQVLSPKKYCIDWRASLEDVRVLVCVIPSEDIPSDVKEVQRKVYSIGMILSTPFLLSTFIVYLLLPELQNLYGKTVMCYVACLIVAYVVLLVTILDSFPGILCAPFAYTIYFSFLASFFWLNVMCFDIWWTFGGYRSLQGSMKQRERKKFLMYSIYAWGSAIILTAFCITMDNVKSLPENIVVPGFGISSCWFESNIARGLYFYTPMGITIACNICLFISTALKIAEHKRDTAHQLKGMDSRRHDDNKQWFNLYLKLFIVMGINWSMEIISWVYDEPRYLWYITDMGNTLQGVIIFIIFVWKEKIKRLLCKRFGCQGPNFLSRDSTRSAYPSSNSRTCTTSVPLHDKLHDKPSALPDPLAHGKTQFEDSDGV